MKTTLVNFEDNFYIYKGTTKGLDSKTDDIALAIGGYEPVSLANLMASYIFEKTEQWFKKTWVCGIDRDDGVVDKLAGDNYLKFITKLLYSKATAGIKLYLEGKKGEVTLNIWES
eukprot:9675336-Ditylum_brightwellii.AAC.1